MATRRAAANSLLKSKGNELQFATKHLGPFLLTNLLPRSPFFHQRKVVNTSSEAQRVSPVRFSDLSQTPGAKVAFEDKPRRGMPEGILRGDGRREPSVAYGQSKTADVLFSVALNRRGVKSFAVMPGSKLAWIDAVDLILTRVAIATDLMRDMDEQGIKSLTHGSFGWKNLDKGAATLNVAGFDPQLDTEMGVYLDDCQMKRPSKWASEVEKSEKLWKLSEDLVSEKFTNSKESRL